MRDTTYGTDRLANTTCGEFPSAKEATSAVEILAIPEGGS
jgi:hypothetical protein